MIRLRPSGADEVLIKRVRDWYEPGPGVFIAPQALFSPALLFTTGVNGTWYDPSDLTTLFQDAAGTTPVTAVEQPVGKMLDKSGRGNHAFNSSGNSANFPVLSARYNLLTNTVAMTGGAWIASNVTTTANQITAPDGTMTGELVTASAGSNYHWKANGFTTTPSTANTFTVSLAKGTQRYIAVICGDTSGNRFGCTVDTTTWTIVSSGIAGLGVLTSSSITQNANWYTVTISGTASSASIAVYVAARDSSAWNGETLLATAGGGTWYNWGFDLRTSNDALNQPAYQRVNTATDYDTAGFKPYLRFNGVNQWLQTNNIDFAYGDKMFVCAGVRKFSDAALVGCIAEISVDASVNNGTFTVDAPRYPNVTNSVGFENKGTTMAAAYYSGTNTAPPSTFIVSAVGDISAPSATLRVNSSQVAQSTTTQGTGNYGNYPMFIGARAGSLLWFNGRLHQLVVAGKQASASEISSTETYINQKTGAY